MAEEKTPTAPRWRLLRLTVAAIAVAMSVYHMYVAAVGPPEAVIFRATHLMFAIALVFLLYPTRAGGGVGWRLFDFALLCLGLAFVLNIFVNYEAFTNRIFYIDELTSFRCMEIMVWQMEVSGNWGNLPSIGIQDY